MSKEREYGWRLYSADFSVQASGKETATGVVMFIRSPTQKELWHKMPEELIEAEDGPPLYVVGHGFTFDEAFDNAIRAAVNAKPIPVGI